MDPLILEPLMESGSTGLLVALILTAFRYIESKQNKRNGDDVCVRVTVLEKTVEELSNKLEAVEDELSSLRKEFREFREEARLTWARQQAKEDALR